MKRFAMVLVVLLSACAVGNCGNTKLVASVTNPTYAGQHFKRVLVIGMSDHMGHPLWTLRTPWLARLKQDGVHAIPGHNILHCGPKGTKMGTTI